MQFQDDEREDQADLSCLWPWACRVLNPNLGYKIDRSAHRPQAADVALVKITELGNHSHVVLATNERRTLYPGDHLLGVLGNRYATDAFEAEVTTVDDLHMLTNAGMLGTVCSRHRAVKAPTKVRFLGFLANQEGQRINLKSSFFKPRRISTARRNVVAVVGTGMNSGKTTTAARLVKELVNQGLRVAACKLTGSVSHRDLFQLRSASPVITSDFSDYGFPSTYLCEPNELVDLFHTMVTDLQRADPDLVIMELADGVLQRETRMLLGDTQIQAHLAGTLLTAPCALSALEGVRQVRSMSHPVIAVSGIITNAPLFAREFTSRSDVPLLSVFEAGDKLAKATIDHVATVQS